MNRRQFLARVGATGALIAGAAAAGTALWQPKHFVPGFQVEKGIALPDFSVAADPAKPVLAIAHGQSRGEVIKAAVDALGGMGRFVQKGDVVLLKPNVAFDRPPSLGATTDPETLRAVAQLVREAGAREILVADNPINSPVGCFLKSGITKVAEALDLKILYPEAAAFETLEIDGVIMKRWPMFYAPFHKRATKVIGLAPCKDHNLSHASMTMKNWYGLLGGRRNQFHQHIHEIIADFALMIRPTLVVLDGMRVLMSNGPTGGRLSDVKEMNTIIAGTDMVAVDACGYETLLGRDLAELTYVHMARERGLGNDRWKDQNYKELQA